MNHFKTVESNTEPAFIITNDLGDNSSPDNGLLIATYWYNGDEGETAPKLTMDTDGVLYLSKDDIPKIISALEEFL